VGARAKDFQARVLDNFATGLTEISFVPSYNALLVKSFFEPDCKNKLFYTECQLSSNDMHEFKINPKTYRQEITFPLKEVKAMLSLCRDLSFDIFLHFGPPGHPLLMSNSKDEKSAPLYVEVIVSTLDGPDEEDSPLLQEELSQNMPPEGKEKLSSGKIQDEKMLDEKMQLHDETVQEPGFTPTQTSSWAKPKSSKPQESSHNFSDHNTEVDSKISFDLYPPNDENAVEGNTNLSHAKRRRIDKPKAKGSESDSDSSFVAGTPQSEEG